MRMRERGGGGWGFYILAIIPDIPCSASEEMIVCTCHPAVDHLEKLSFSVVVGEIKLVGASAFTAATAL